MIDIRLGNRHNHNVNDSVELIEAIQKHPGSCDTVWFATEYGYPELARHEESGKRIEKIAELYRAAGIKVSLQVSNTIGHGEYMKSKDNSAIDSHNFEKIIGPDGTVADYSFCWRGKNFIDYCVKSIEAYMNIKPATVWIDDDLRVLNHAPVERGCFCDTCMATFNNEYGFNYTREELVHEINYGDVSVREKFVNFLRQGMYDFTLTLTKAIQKLSPDTQMALQYARVSNYTGMNYNYLVEAMRDGSGKSPKTRPGGGVYDDKTPMKILDKMLWVSYSNCALPDYVTDNYPEIENTPDVIFGKSIYGTIKESTLYLAYGCNGLTYATLMTPYERIGFHERMLRGFSEYREYWDELAKYAEGTKNGGALIYDPPKAYLRPLSEDEAPFRWEEDFEEGSYIRRPQPLMKLGMPVTLDKTGGCLYLLSEGSIKGMTDADIEDMMTKPVMIDGPAFKKILERGYADAFKVTIDVAPGGITEFFTEHPVNKGNEDMTWTESFFSGSRMVPHVLNGDGMEPIGEFKITKTGEKIGASCAIVHVYDKNGNKTADWAVFGYSIWHDVLSSAKRQQIIYAADYICGHNLPAILETPEQVVVLPRVDADKKTTSVTLVNASIGKTEGLLLRVRNAKGSTFRLRNAECNMPAEVEKEGNDYLVKVPALGAWDIITLFIEE